MAIASTFSGWNINEPVKPMTGVRLHLFKSNLQGKNKRDGKRWNWISFIFSPVPRVPFLSTSAACYFADVNWYCSLSLSLPFLFVFFLFFLLIFFVSLFFRNIRLGVSSAAVGRIRVAWLGTSLHVLIMLLGALCICLAIRFDWERQEEEEETSVMGKAVVTHEMIYAKSICQWAGCTEWTVASTEQETHNTGEQSDLCTVHILLNWERESTRDQDEDATRINWVGSQ